CFRVGIATDNCGSNGSHFVMHSHGFQGSNGPGSGHGFGVFALGAQDYIGAGFGQTVNGSVDQQPNEAPRWVTQVVNACHGFLSLIASLVEVDCGTQPVEFVWDGTIVGIDQLSGTSRCDAQSFGGHRTGKPETIWQVGDSFDQRIGVKNIEPPGVVFVYSGVISRIRGVSVTTGNNAGPGVDPHGGIQGGDLIGCAK